MAATDKQIVLVTGANGGIGFELVAQLLKKAKYIVLLGSRSVEKGDAAVKDLQSRNLPGEVELLQLDTKSDESIDQAVKTIESKYGKLDALVNNAAVALSQAASLREKMIDCFDTNAAGVAVMGFKFQPLLAKSTSGPRMINVSSGMGSVGMRLDPKSSLYDMTNEWPVPYRTSKAALSMVTAHMSVGNKKMGIKTFQFCPGFTISNLGPHNNAENGARPASEPALELVDIIEGKRDDEEAGFLHGKGQYPW